MTPERLSLPQGTLDLLILKILALGPENGWAISERIQHMTGDALQVPQGSLYPALHRLERKGVIKASWRTTEHNRRAKYYTLTPAGERRLAAELDSWARLTSALNAVLGTA